MGSYALLGEKLGHSLSPQLHAAIYRQLGKTDTNYRSVEVAPEKVPDFFAGFAAGAFDGINITIPYKATALSFLQQIDAKAKRLNAVNCVHLRHGELVGYNTDVSGFAYLLRRHGRMLLRDWTKPCQSARLRRCPILWPSVMVTQPRKPFGRRTLRAWPSG